MSKIASLLVVVAASLAAGLGGCAASGAVSIQPGYFFGHDLRHEQSIVYVLDLSGSMRGGSGSIVENVGTDVGAKVGGGLVGGFFGKRTGKVVEDGVQKLRQKVEKVKIHLIASLNGLPPGSRFNVLLFSNGVQKLAPVMIDTSPASVGLVSAFVSQLEASGSTSLMAALQAGMSAGGQHVIVLTDGLPTDASPQQIMSMVSQVNASHTMRISTVGVGHDQDLGFLRDLAMANGGSFVSYD